MKKTSTAIIAAVVMCASPALVAQSDAPAAQPDAGGASAEPASGELEHKQQELADLSQQISAIEQEAREAPPVQEKMDNFRDTVIEEMVRQAPELEEEIVRQGELVEELNGSEPEAMDEGERQEKMAEFQELRQQIEPVELKAQQSEAVVAARDAFYDQLTEEMRRIDPQTDDLLTRYREVAEEISGMQDSS